MDKMQKLLTASRSARILADMKPLANMLTEWRETLKLSPAEAARLCNMTRQQWWELETGRTTDPRSSTLQKLATGSGIPIQRLVAASCSATPPKEPALAK